MIITDYIHKAARDLADAKNVVALTGAGISVESGIPPFRGKGGLWEKFDPMEYAHIDAFIKDPAKVWNVLIKDMKEIIEKRKIVVGYHGALAEWLDYQLIKYIASSLNNVEVVLIGPDYDGSIKKSNITKINNIHWLGPKAYQDLPKYLRWFSVAILPFKINKITLSTSPIKLFEYMAASIPIVSVDIPEPRKYKSVLVAKDYEDFICLINKAVHFRTNPEYLKLLEEEARDNSWEKRAKLIDKVIQKKFQEIRESYKHEN